MATQNQHVPHVCAPLQHPSHGGALEKTTHILSSCAGWSEIRTRLLKPPSPSTDSEPNATTHGVRKSQMGSPTPFIQLFMYLIYLSNNNNVQKHSNTTCIPVSIYIYTHAHNTAAQHWVGGFSEPKKIKIKEVQGPTAECFGGFGRFSCSTGGMRCASSAASCKSSSA